MIDAEYLVKNPNEIKDVLKRRQFSSDVIHSVDDIVRNHNEIKVLTKEKENIFYERNVASDIIKEKIKAKEDFSEYKNKVSLGKERVIEIDKVLANLQELQSNLVLNLPNLLHKDVPTGQSEHENVVVKTYGAIKNFEFTPKDHVELGENLDIIDNERAAKLSGTRFSVLKGMGAKLERALINFFIDTHTSEHGYTEVMTPYIVQEHALNGTGQLPKFEKDLFKLSEKVNGSDAYLIPTAEVPVTNLHADEIFKESELPKKYVCFSPCFRSEAGSAGRDVRGLIRQHQFHKVEMVWFSKPEDADSAHEQLTRHAEIILEKLGLPYRRVLLCSGDMSSNAYKCYDLEVWLPSQNTYREISSCSQFSDFQSRRMKSRYKPEDGSKNQLVHTLNGSGLAVGRTLVAILENYQQEDGSILIPEVLRVYFSSKTHIRNE